VAHAVHVLKVALTALVLTFVACLLAAIIGVENDSTTLGLVMRTLLVAASLFGAAAYWVIRGPDHAMAPELTRNLSIGLVLGGLLNPQLWIGRAFVGQTWADTGTPSAAVDLVAWLVVSVALAAFLSARAENLD
jgi:hypothetical protein